MFQAARIKLTAWYLLIIMLVSVFFSVTIYSGINREFGRIEHFQNIRNEQQKRGFDSMFGELRLERERQGMPAPPMRRFILAADPEIIRQARVRLTTFLVLINLGILAAAGASGYFLAGKTLLPIEEMMDDQKRFVTDASHELRTPLTALRTEIEVNLRDKKMTLGNAKKLLKSNLEEVKNLQSLSDGLIKLSQYQKDNNGVEFAEISLAEIVGEAVKKVAGLAKSKSITIINEAEDLIFEGINDRQTLTEFFVIFLDNAIKYSPEGREVKITSGKIDGYILINIADQGIGIAKEDIHYVFDRFYRTDKSRAKSDVAGYGLGLSIAKQIVDKHRGSIKVASESGKGTTFTIHLPVKNKPKD